jgi:hypothetical protein
MSRFLSCMVRNNTNLDLDHGNNDLAKYRISIVCWKTLPYIGFCIALLTPVEKTRQSYPHKLAHEEVVFAIECH